MRSSLFRCKSGVALIEFALVLPLLILLFLGTMETARYIIMQQKVDKVANSMADFATKAISLKRSDFDSFVIAVPEIMRPYKFDGTVIFSSVSFFPEALPPCKGKDVGCVDWQVTELGSDASQVGTTGGNATIPGNYQVIKGQNVITAEVYLNYEPLFAYTGSLIAPLSAHKLYKIAVYKPRQGSLTTLNDN